jgi:LDH2 family malate/lactate/ureidoglycolate dehydrogenase
MKIYTQESKMVDEVLVAVKDLQNFTAEILRRYGLGSEDAAISAEVLVRADQRGISSHGVARLQRYIDGLEQGVIIASPVVKILKETPVSLLIDGGGGMGPPITFRAMQRCVEKAQENFLCFAAIRNSNHYGIAGYYVQMALEAGMIGISLTNTAPLVVPTFGRSVVIGTNPIAVGFPTGSGHPFLLDMATSTVPRGKLEVYARKGEPIPDCWACDAEGVPSTDPVELLRQLVERNGGGLLPLGGASELTGGHKGYGLSAVVDIFCGVLSGGAFGINLYQNKEAPSGVAHFVGAINPAAFIGLDELQQRVSDFCRMLKDAPKAAGQERIFVAGEKEYEAEQRHHKYVPLEAKVFAQLEAIGSRFGLSLRAKNETEIQS